MQISQCFDLKGFRISHSGHNEFASYFSNKFYFLKTNFILKTNKIQNKFNIFFTKNSFLLVPLGMYPGSLNQEISIKIIVKLMKRRYKMTKDSMSQSFLLLLNSLEKY